MTEAGFSLGGWVFTVSNPLIWMVSGLLLVSLLATLRACWRRLRPDKLSRAVVIALLNLLAFGTVFLLLLEPERQHLVERDVILITEGASVDAADYPGDANVYIAPGVSPNSSWNNAGWLLDVGQLKLREPALTGIEVRGYGLGNAGWQSLPADIRVAFQKPPVDGFTGMHWPRTLVAGETIRIEGRYSAAESDNDSGPGVVQLRLLDPAGDIVSEARIRNGDDFSLPVRPKSPGNLAYILQALHGETLLSEQLVTLSVNAATVVSVMVEQSAPSFETRQLKNYAASNGARVLINTQISRGKSISQTANLPDGAESTFSPQTLALQDVLIMDGRAVVDLSGQQRQWLSDAIDQGLGLLVLADVSLLEAFDGQSDGQSDGPGDGLDGRLDDGLFAGFELGPNADATEEVVPNLLSNPASGWQQTLPVAAMQLQAMATDVLIDDGQGHALVINKPKGLGHIAISLISQSHRWLTSGNRDHWSDYWAALISAASRPRDVSYLLPADDTAFYQVGERIPVCVMSAEESVVAVVIPPVTSDGQTKFEVPLVADTFGSSRHCGGFQAIQSGWHQLQLRSEANAPLLDQQGVYIISNDEWLSQLRQQRVNATMNRLAQNLSAPDEKPEGKLVSEPINNTWLWLLLVLSASLLWLERKLDFEW